MDLTVLYDIRDRLKTGAIAGTGLVTQDFRLTRALESLVPLESASPVFARLGQSVRLLLADDCADRAGALLDALSLCDAILTTQAGTAVQASVEPMVLHSKGKTVSSAPYSALSPLLEALTTSGSGKYSLVMEAHEQQPQLFDDYRVKHAMVTALGAQYAELADRVAEWLGKEDSSILPLLRQGFDPQGKKEMVRRLQVIEQIAGAAENDFYLSLLDDAEKEIKAAAVYALRHDKGNAERLLTLLKTEKGQVKKSVHWALASMDDKAVREYWDKLFAKNPGQAAEYMSLSTADHASKAVARSLSALLDTFAGGATLTKDSYPQLQQLLQVLVSKGGAEICAVYRQAALLGTALDQPTPDNKEGYTFRRDARNYDSHYFPFSQVIPVILASAIHYNPTEELVSLAESLYEQHGSRFLMPVVAAALTSKSSEETYRPAADVMHPGFRLLGPKKEDKEALESLGWLMGKLCIGDGQTVPSLELDYHNPLIERSFSVIRKLAAPLDVRWYLDAVQHTGCFDRLLALPFWPQNSKVRQAVGKYFYELCHKQWNNRKYLRVLSELGWTKYDGLFMRFCENESRLSFWDIHNYLSELPVSNAQKIKELEALQSKVDSKKIKVYDSNFTEHMSNLMEQLR